MIINSKGLLPNSFQNIPLYYFENIPSTNQILWDYLDQGKTAPMIAIADQQTAGRGQWGRTWQSSLGGLYLSLMLPLDLNIECVPHLTLLSGVGIAQILRTYQIPVQLKWPNDLILKGHKLGGIKTETRLQKEKMSYVVIGVGINGYNPVPPVGINLESYCQQHALTTITSLQHLATLTLEGLLKTYQRYQTEGMSNILSDYWEMFAYKDQLIPLAGGTARIIGITPQGELKVSLMSVGAKTELCLSPGTISLGYDQKD